MEREDGELEIEEAGQEEDTGRWRKRKRREQPHRTEQGGTKTHKEQPSYDDMYETTREQQSHREKIVQEIAEYNRDTVVWMAPIQGES